MLMVFADCAEDFLRLLASARGGAGEPLEKTLYCIYGLTEGLGECLPEVSRA